jgi:hypothetical protein
MLRHVGLPKTSQDLHDLKSILLLNVYTYLFHRRATGALIAFPEMMPAGRNNPTGLTFSTLNYHLSLALRER